MDKMLFSEGGQPLYLDDLAYLQDSLRSGLSLFFSALGNCVLEGTMTGNDATLQWDECIVLVGGEICRLPAGQMDFETPPEKVYITLVSRPTEERIFGDGSSHPVREERVAQVTTVVTAGQPAMVIYTENKGFLTSKLSLQEWLKSQLLKKQDFRAKSDVGTNPQLSRWLVGGEVVATKGSIYFANETTLQEGVIMHHNGAYGGLYGKALVHTDKLGGGVHVYLGGNYVALKDAAGNNLTRVPADTHISFSF